MPESQLRKSRRKHRSKHCMARKHGKKIEAEKVSACFSYNTIKAIEVFELWRENVGQKNEIVTVGASCLFFPLNCTDIFTESKVT